MKYKLLVNCSNPPTAAILATGLINASKNAEVEVVWQKEWKGSGNVQLLDAQEKVIAESSNEVNRYFARTTNTDLYGGINARERTEVDHWISFAMVHFSNNSLTDTLSKLNDALLINTWLVSKKLTLADIHVLGALIDIDFVEKYGKQYNNINRWYTQMLAVPAVTDALASVAKNKSIPSSKAAKTEKQTGKQTSVRKQEGKFIDLPGAEMGKVVVRFPPEASGYLHIGHAKAALLNQYYAEAFQGQLIMRFDDTNPAKENVEFEQAILHDLELLQVKADRFTHSSDYFDLMLEYCTKLIKDGKAFVDDTPAHLMKEQRDQKAKSDNRDNSIEKNLELWSEMQKGTPKGQECCVRVKIDYESANGCLRDPTIYRCKPEPHPRTGTKYKVYPTYDFACPIVDAVENVTHTLRTTEYHDRDAQFYWLIDALGLRRPYIWEYSRLNMTNTVLSKRRLTWFVDQGLVDGWDDPRFPTVRGILRRGMTVEGLKQFIIAQGSSKSVVFMEWDKIWAFNRKVIDPVAIRYTALEHGKTVPVHVIGAKEEFLTVQNHPKDTSRGTKEVLTSPLVYIEKEDAEQLAEGQNATFINWGNILIQKVEKKNGVVTKVTAKTNLENKDYKNTLKLTWLGMPSNNTNTSIHKNTIPCFVVYFDHIIDKPVLGKDDDFKDFVAKNTRTEIQMIGESELKRVKKGEIIQLQRKGYCICDVPYTPMSSFSSREQPLILFNIPDGHTTPQKTSATNASVTATVKETPKDNSKPSNGDAINSKIIAQGEKVRRLKAEKAEKSVIEMEVKVLLSLKADYKSCTGSDWKPGIASKPFVQPVESDNKKSELMGAISEQEARIIELQKKLSEETTRLLNLKNNYKKSTGEEWTANAVAKDASSAENISTQIEKQGDKVRQLKTGKADKNVIDQEVKELLRLKADYKKATGKEWKPTPATPTVTAKPKEITEKPMIDAQALSEKVQSQGDKVRQLKSTKAEKAIVDQEVKNLLNLKAEYKAATGQEWKPSPAKPVAVSPSADSIKPAPSADDLSNEIQKQGNKVRELKGAKAGKSVIDQEVKTLLNLKAEYKAATGQEWKPSPAKPVAVCPSADSIKPAPSADDLSNEIQKQGDKVRELKGAKAGKSVIDQEVKTLLNLKAGYKAATGQDWKPSPAKPVAVSPSADSIKPAPSADDLSNEIQKQGDKVRELKSAKAGKSVIDQEVKILLNLKAEYKAATGQDWKPSPATPVAASPSKDTIKSAPSGEKLSNEIQKQGDKVRELKSAKAEKSVIDQEVKVLLNLKNEFKNVTGQEWKPAKSDAPAKQKKKDAPQKNEKQSNKEIQKSDASKELDATKTGTRLGLEAKKEENFFEWYSQIITKSGMIEYYDVSGCYILRPWSFAIWKSIKDYIEKEISKLGVQECYFPIFVTRSVLEKEKAHIDDFAPEVAWVTKCGDSELAEPIAIRPTSETVMYPAYAKWLRSDTELPLRLNQWNNVVRWEFKDPKPFLRTREFLWQEGHTAFATKAEADEEVLIILEMYAKVYEDLLAVPVVKGRKTEKEKFAGGDYTTTVEAFISTSGRAIQGATSHHLGQNFSKMFNIQVEGIAGTDEKSYVYQNSWGMTTRTVGVMIMVHGDDKGLVLPPNVACIQAIIVPCGLTATTTPEQRTALLEECNKLLAELSKDSSLRVEADYRSNRTPGWKFNHWELKGVPVRIELGPKDLQKNQVTYVRRDNSERLAVKRNVAAGALRELLSNIHETMLSKARNNLNEHIKQVETWDAFCTALNKKNLLLSPFCGVPSCEDNIKADSAREDAGEELGTLSMGAKSLCIPFDQPKTTVPLNQQKCIHPACHNTPKFYTLFGRSY